MKKLISFLLCLCVVGACAAAEDSSFALLQKLYTAGENTVFSPVSLFAALGMAAEGAEGDTRDEILALISETTSGEIHSANALFTAPDILLKDDYRAAIDQGYGAEYFPIDEAIVEKVNAWISEQTDGMIEDFMQTPPEKAGLILINAVAMEKDWAKPFEEYNTYEADFFAGEQTLPVQMMHQTSHFDYCEKDGAQIIRLPYKDSSLEMWIALPEEGGMDTFLAGLCENGLEYFTADATAAQVFLSLPKIDVADENSLREVLMQLGMCLAFGEDADFSGISETAMYISGVVQKARLQVNEKSTKAAAATMISLARGAMMEMEPPVEMNVNRPYFFAVRDSATGALCFCGVIENPLA